MSSAASAPFDWRQGWRYGLMGLPLAFVALPLYVQLPNYYAKQFGMPLATLGAVLLGARLFDAFIDPLLGRWSDRLYAHSLRHVLAWGAVACGLLALGFSLLFFPQFPHNSTWSFGLVWHCSLPTWAIAVSVCCTSPGARCWAVMRASAAVSWLGAKVWALWASFWHPLCRWPLDYMPLLLSFL